MSATFRVVALNYTLKHSSAVDYVAPPAIEFETEVCRCRLADGKLRCELKKDLEDPEEARSAVAPVLRAWELKTDLQRNADELQFRFEGAEVKDLRPTLPGTITGTAYVVLPAVSMTGNVSVHLTHRSYPDPPGTFAVSPEVETLALRYLGYIKGREPLPGMAFFIISRIEHLGGEGGLRSASKRFGVSSNVLDTIKRLCSYRGDASNARKGDSIESPLTGEERQWLETAVREVILRVGDHEAVGTRPALSMADLPKL
jgi:hypothetical protein